MKKLIIISIILFAGFTSSFAYSNFWFKSLNNYTTETQYYEFTGNYPTGSIFVQVELAKYGVAGVLASGANGTYQLQSTSGVKTATWTDSWTKWEIYLDSAVGGPNDYPGACYAVITY